MAQRARQPQRTCLGCGARDDQRRMLRLSLTEEGQLHIDRDNGRGGYLHRDDECWRKFLGRKGLYRAFRVDVNRATKEHLIKELRGRDWE
jgi:hypothetical protein